MAFNYITDQLRKRLRINPRWIVHKDRTVLLYLIIFDLFHSLACESNVLTNSPKATPTPSFFISSPREILRHEQSGQVTGTKTINLASIAIQTSISYSTPSIFDRATFWAGMDSGISIAQSNFMSNGFSLGANAELIFGSFSLWGGLSTGQMDSRQHQLSTGQFSIDFKDSGSFGFLSTKAGLAYSVPWGTKWRVSLGVGVGLDRYNTSFVSIGPILSVVVQPVVYYELFRNLAFGVQLPVSLMTFTTAEAKGKSMELAQTERIIMTQLLFTFRYKIR